MADNPAGPILHRVAPSTPSRVAGRAGLLAEIAARSTQRRKSENAHRVETAVADAVRRVLEREVSALRKIASASDFASTEAGRNAAAAVTACEQMCDRASKCRERSRMAAEDANARAQRAVEAQKRYGGIARQWQWKVAAEGSRGAHSVYMGAQLAAERARWVALDEDVGVQLDAACDDAETRRSDWQLIKWHALPHGWVAGVVPWTEHAVFLYEPPPREEREANSAAWRKWLEERSLGGARAGADFLLQPPPGSKLVAGIVDVHSMTLDVDGALHALRCVCVSDDARPLAAGDACRAPDGAAGGGVALRAALIVKAPAESQWALVRWTQESAARAGDATAVGRCKRVPRAAVTHAAPPLRWRLARAAQAALAECDAARVSAARTAREEERVALALWAERARAADAANAFDLARTASVQTTCIVCRDAPPVIALLPCGHRCCCADCAHALRGRGSGRCPICRAAVQNSCRIYV